MSEELDLWYACLIIARALFLIQRTFLRSGLPHNIRRTTAVYNVRSRNWSNANLLSTVNSKNCCSFGSSGSAATSPSSSCVTSPTNSGNSSTHSSTPPSLSSSMTDLVLWVPCPTIRKVPKSSVPPQSSSVFLKPKRRRSPLWDAQDATKSKEILLLEQCWQKFSSDAEGLPDPTVVHYAAEAVALSEEEMREWEDRLTLQLLKEVDIDPRLVMC
ncbi:hypothetical protein Ddc_10599 [Ditylenchus destructor]|nr:hypothetical protein Ddc_10599 [Ditylenchus destructor]